MSEKNEPVEVASVTLSGATFAERKAAREAAEKPATKAVQDDDEATENKAVKSASTKSRKS